MKVKVDSFLTEAALGGATSKSPAEAEITSVKFIEATDLPFPSEEGRYELTVSLNEESYDWMANKTSLRAFVSAFGDDSDNWSGKTIKLWSVEQNVGGKMKQVIYAAV